MERKKTKQRGGVGCLTGWSICLTFGGGEARGWVTVREWRRSEAVAKRPGRREREEEREELREKKWDLSELQEREGKRGEEEDKGGGKNIHTGREECQIQGEGSKEKVWTVQTMGCLLRCPEGIWLRSLTPRPKLSWNVRRKDKCFGLIEVQLRLRGESSGWWSIENRKEGGLFRFQNTERRNMGKQTKQLPLQMGKETRPLFMIALH